MIEIRPDITDEGIARIRDWWSAMVNVGAPFVEPYGELPIPWIWPDGVREYVDAGPIRDLIPDGAVVDCRGE